MNFWYLSLSYISEKSLAINWKQLSFFKSYLYSELELLLLTLSRKSTNRTLNADKTQDFIRNLRKLFVEEIKIMSFTQKN